MGEEKKQEDFGLDEETLKDVPGGIGGGGLQIRHCTYICQDCGKYYYGAAHIYPPCPDCKSKNITTQ